MKTFVFISPFVLLLLPLLSGNKDPAPNTEITDMLTLSAWTAMESWKDTDGDGIFTFDTPDCQADNNWDFHTDGSFLLTEDSLKCEPDLTFLDSLACNWTLTNNETILGLAFPATSEELDFQIMTVGNQEMILYLIDPDFPNDPAREKIVLKR